MYSFVKKKIIEENNYKTLRIRLKFIQFTFQEPQHTKRLDVVKLTNNIRPSKNKNQSGEFIDQILENTKFVQLKNYPLKDFSFEIKIYDK